MIERHSVETSEGARLCIASDARGVVIEVVDPDGDDVASFQLSPYSAIRLAMLLDEAAG